MNSIGVIIGRFQTSYLHDGHKFLIDSVKTKHQRTVIVMGTSPLRGSIRNPLDFHTREKMIKKSYPEVLVLPQADNPTDEKWSINLDNLLEDAFPGFKFKLYGSRDSFIPHYKGRFEVVELPEAKGYNATIIREEISNNVIDSQEFRTGIIFAYSNTYPRVFPTVDITVFRNNKTEILLGTKAKDGKWRLPGGFSDPDDDSFEFAAQRELREECGPMDVSVMQYEGSFKINDWRYRTEVDKIITTLFSTEFINGTPKAGDDLDGVQWYKLNDLGSMIERGEIVNEHLPLFNYLIKKYL